MNVITWECLFGHQILTVSESIFSEIMHKMKQNVHLS